VSNPANATTTQMGRIYTWKGEQFPSVTTILGAAMPKPALKSWAAKMVAEYAFDHRSSWETLGRDAAVDLLKREPLRMTTKAADLGSAVHAAAEAYAKRQAPPHWPAEIAPHMQQFARFVDDYHPRFRALEATVYNRSQGYAGTTDFIAEIDGLTLLGDTKSGKAIYPEVALQLAAYRNGEFVGRPDGSEAAIPPLNGTVVLHLTPTDYALREVRTDTEIYLAFLTALEMYEWHRDIASTVLKGPLPRPTREAAA
jgi:hypothetical protein